MTATTTTTSTIDRAALQARIDALPRVRLAHLPTPLDHCPRLSEALGGPDIRIKRDDLTGLAFGGNKTRQLEFVFADILADGADTVVAGAYTQSNWCRQITGAARKLGLDVALVLLHGEKGPALQGNLLLDRLMGADVTVVDLDSMERLTPVLEAKAAELERAGRKPYILRPFGLDKLALGAVGYVNGALELDAQLEAAGIEPDFLYLCGANMTPAGLALGLKALGRGTRLINVAPILWSEPRAVDIARIAGATAARLDLSVSIVPEDIDNHDDYIGPRYGVVTEGGREAMRLVAGTEGIILDPVYSAKAMAGLINHVRSGRIGKGQTVVFLHTGGTPALFAYADDLDLEPPRTQLMP
jgi:D-cysteine desulfhydrase family pyridoxal phosphate-dependent enzyme